VQPPARDYVPRRSGELAVPLLQAYAFFRHNTYDAGGACFVPGNLIFEAIRVAQLPFNYDEQLSKNLFAIRRGSVLGGSSASRGFFACAHPSLHLGLQILAQVFRNDAGRRQFP
jgi:hypothetical protein